MNVVNICCDIYHCDDKVGRLEIIDGKLVKNDVYTDKIILHPCPNSHTLHSVLAILESRVICRERCDEAMLKHMNLTHYNVYDILRHTHGVDIDDFIWFKFDEDRRDLSWSDVKVRG